MYVVYMCQRARQYTLQVLSPLCRLTVLLEQQQQQQPPSSVDPPPSPLREAGGVRERALEKAVGKLGRQLEDRQALNARLKQQLASSSFPPGRDLSGGHCESGARGSIADRYLDFNRSQLLSTIVDLQLVYTRVCVC